MSRRNQARRRRTYGRRQHEVRERRTERPSREQDEQLEAQHLDGLLQHDALDQRHGGRAAA